MNFSLSRVWTIARRDYLATVRRKAFVFTIVGTPLLYTGLMMLVIKPQVHERLESVKRFKVMALVDSSGVFANAPKQVESELSIENPFSGTKQAPEPLKYHTEIRPYADLPSAQHALEAGDVQQILVVPKDYLDTGNLRRYASSNNMLSSNEEGIVSRWLVRGLFADAPDPRRVERAARPLHSERLYTRNTAGIFELNDDRRQIVSFLMPFALGLLLGLSIVIGGQYLLQGVNEEKESRILESMLCSVSPEEFLTGKLIGLGSAGLTLILAWISMGAVTVGPMLAMAQVTISPGTVAAMIGYFILGYLFYGSLMTGIGAMASNMREAAQFSVWFSILNFIPFYMLTVIIGRPSAPLAVGLSMFPPTAPVSMMLRLTSPDAAVPLWQIALSMAILAGAGVLVLMASARIFRVGMLMYGKTPNLPEIVRWVRQG